MDLALACVLSHVEILCNLFKKCIFSAPEHTRICSSLWFRNISVESWFSIARSVSHKLHFCWMKQLLQEKIRIIYDYRLVTIAAALKKQDPPCFSYFCIALNGPWHLNKLQRFTDFFLEVKVVLDMSLYVLNSELYLTKVRCLTLFVWNIYNF